MFSLLNNISDDKTEVPPASIDKADEFLKYDCEVNELLKDKSGDILNTVAEPYDLFDTLLYGDKQPKAFVPTDTHYYDEEDYQYHRHRTYPHVHQPLKSMEPRILMDIKMRIKASKRSEAKAAKAGVASCVPELLASASDTRVLIDTTSKVSGPVLSLVRESVSCSLQIPDRKKRKRKRRRSKKQEPFKPTLCKLSEESSSPLHSAAIDADDDNSCDGLLLSELSDVIRSLHDTQSKLKISDNHSPVARLTFLDEIILLDPSTTFLDSDQNITQDYSSYPFFDNMDDGMDNVISKQRFVDITDGGEKDEEEEKIEDDVFVYIGGEVASLVTNQSSSVAVCTDVVPIPMASDQSWSCGVGDDGYVCALSLVECDRDNDHDHDHDLHHHHHHHRRHHHSHKEYYDQCDLDHRIFSGQDMRSLWQARDTAPVHEYEAALDTTIVLDIQNAMFHVTV